MTVYVIGLLDNEEQSKEVIFIAKLMVIGNRAQELSQQVNKNDGNNLG